MKASVKYKVIYRHKDSYSISEMCRFFEVSRSGYYDFVNRLDTPAKDLPLDQMIQQCQEQCRNTYLSCSLEMTNKAMLPYLK